MNYLRRDRASGVYQVTQLLPPEGEEPDDARRCIDDAINKVERSKEKWCEADISRIAGEIALISPERDAVGGKSYFERALSVARQQQAKS